MEEARLEALSLIADRVFTTFELWVAFYGIGGTAEMLEFEAYIYGLMPVSVTDAQLLSQALLELTGNW